MLAESGGISEDQTASALDELLERRLVRDQIGGSYDFSHDNIRQVAYTGLGSARRRLLHQRISRAQIISAAGSSATAAAIGAPNTSSWAGSSRRRSTTISWPPSMRSASMPALTLCYTSKRAIELVKQLPASGGHLAHEIDLRTALCSVLLSVEGYAGPMVLREHACLRSLCDKAGAITPAPPLLRCSLAHPLVMRGELRELAEVGQRLLSAVPAGAAIPFSRSKRATCLA